jgi:hypothetical protein
MKTLVKRIGHIEDLLGNEPSPGKLSPALQDAVDRIHKRLAPTEKASEDAKGGKNE